MYRRLLAEDPLQFAWIGVRDVAWRKASEPLLQLQRTGERRLHRHLLVECEADQ